MIAAPRRAQHFVTMFGFRAVVIVALAASSAAAQTGRVTGVVYDSVSSRPLSGAFVQLIDRSRPETARSVESDARGEFAIDSVAPGRYVLGFFHPTLDTLGLKSVTIDVQVATGDVRATLAIPSRKAIIGVVCGAGAADAGTGLWIGTIRSAVNRQPVPGARIAAEWTVLRLSGRLVGLDDFAAEDTTSDSGGFAICGFRAGEHLMARAVAGGDSSGTLGFFAPSDGFLVQDVYVGPFEARTSLDPTRGNSVVSLWGNGVLGGTVRRSSGQAIPGARVVFSQRPESRTGNDGAFTLDSLPLGTHSLEIRALGYVPSRRLVHVTEQNERVDFVLDSRETFLDTVQVVGQRSYESPRYKQFLERKKIGNGTFLDEVALEKRRVTYVADYLRRVPGIFVISTRGFGGQQIAMRHAFGGGYCSPDVFIDGMRVSNGAAELEALVIPAEIRGMEIYTRAGVIPPEFQSLNSGCGSLVIWTGPRKYRPGDPERKP
jgi:hypothetical protein